MSLPAPLVRAGVAHLRKNDPVMREVISAVGPFEMRLRRGRFRTLVHSIIGQQISTSAARSIRLRLLTHLGPGGLKPHRLAQHTPASLRPAGISPQKAGYLLDLAAKVHAREVRLEHVHRLSDEEIIAELVKVKGVGVWTAQMFLMSCLGRPDVFPFGDLGIRNAIRNLYQLKDMPDEKTAHEIAKPWRPYATLASWYCWRSLDLKKPGGG